MFMWCEKIKNKFRDCRHNNEGAILVEVAFFMPILVSLLLLSVEASRYILVNQKISRAATTVGDLMTRVGNPEAQVNDIMFAATNIVAPFDTGDQMRVITTMVMREVGQEEEVMWRAQGAGLMNVTSQIGAVNDSATLPDGFELRENEIIFVTEVFYRYEPLFNYGFWSDKNLYITAFHKPRLQNLTLLEGGS